MVSLVSWGNDLNDYMIKKKVIDIIAVIRISHLLNNYYTSGTVLKTFIYISYISLSNIFLTEHVTI